MAEPNVGPYDALEPEPETHPPSPDERTDRYQPAHGVPGRTAPSIGRAIARGCLKRCPRCGGREVFERWLTMRERCPKCQLRFEREQGDFLGAMTINYGITTLAWVAMMIVWLAITLPRVPVAPLMIASISLMVVLPLVFYPFSKTIWAALEYLVSESEPLEPDPREPFPD